MVPFRGTLGVHREITNSDGQSDSPVEGEELRAPGTV